METAVALTVLCCVLVALTLLAEYKSWHGLVIAGKPSASLSFLALAGYGLLAGESTDSYALLVAAGLVFGAIGDVALLSKEKRWFLVGLVSFLIGHVAYLVAFAGLTSIADWGSSWAVAPVVGTIVVLRYLWAHLGSMRIPVLAYMAAILLMVLAAIALATASAPPMSPQGVALVLVGALLFFVSDIAVAKARFVERRFIDRLWGLPSYYAGQLCIAWSLLA